MNTKPLKTKNCPACGATMTNVGAMLGRLCEECGHEEQYTNNEVNNILRGTKKGGA